jgi:PAS domain S-box-containing protein
MFTQPDYAALFTASPYPYLLINRDFIIIGANPAYLQSTGRTAEQIVGLHIFEAFPADPNDPDSTNLAEVRISIEQAFATKQPHTSALLRYAVPRETPDGRVFDERYWSAIHTPVFDAAGNVVFVSQNAIDVTDLYRFDVATRKYYLKQGVNAVPDMPQMNRPQMHEAMTRILSLERSQLQKMFNQAPSFIAVLTGEQHVFEMANEAYYQLVGHRELIGKPLLEALPEVMAQGVHRMLDDVFASGEPVVLRDSKISLQRHPDGPLEDRYIDLLYQPIIDQDGRVTGIFAQGSDVTGAYRATQALSEKVGQLEEIRASQAFQLALADRIRQFDDPDDVIEAACALLGHALGVTRVLYARIDDAEGTASIRHDWTATGSASLAGRVMTMNDFGPGLIAALRTGRTIANDDVAQDRFTLDHTAAYADIGIRADLLVPFVKAGKLIVVLTVQDAAPRVWREVELRMAQETAERTWSAVEAARARAALRSERDQSQSIFDSMGEGFAVLDKHWTILRMNAEGLRLTQLRAEDVIGRDHWEIWPELLGTPVETVYRRVMETGVTEIIELPVSMPDGRQIWMEVRTHRSIDGGIAFFFRDVTERRQAQEQLTVADRRKDEFLAMLAHELRNPLAPIGAAADLLQRARLDEAQVRQTSQIIGRQVRHMTSLVDDLLDVSRVTRGLVALHTERLDIRHIVNDAIEQVTPLIHARRQHLTLALPPQSPLVEGDRKRLVQVLANLLNNAAKYTHEGGQITLSTEVRDTHVLLHVTDDGIGMAPELVTRAFELFSQAERSSDRSLGGLGLGLALVKSLIDLHHGTVTCQSAGQGKGSTFTVCLPRMASEAPVAESPAAGITNTPAPSDQLRIMVVDDNEDAAAMLALLLESNGHEVHVEHAALPALAASEHAAPHVFLLDIGLPDIDGVELARRLRARANAQQAVLVAITGYGQEQDRARTAAAGFNHHLVKPVDMQKLYAILDEVSPARVFDSA